MIYHVLLGTAIGDALGMPFEKVLPDDSKLLSWNGGTFLPSKHHGLEAGFFTDDTQLSLIVAESLIENNGFNPEDLSQRYLKWFDSGEARGIGRTTRMAMQNLKNGKHWGESGISDSYGNGTAMRSAAFGVFYRNDLSSLIQAVKIDNAITHASVEAESGALAIALAAYLICNDIKISEMNKLICSCLSDSVVKEKISSLDEILTFATDHRKILKHLGTKADVRETVPSALYCFQKFRSFQDGVEAAIRAGYDSDTTAAIVGALSAIKYGKSNIPDYWINNVENGAKLMSLDNQLSVSR